MLGVVSTSWGPVKLHKAVDVRAHLATEFGQQIFSMVVPLESPLPLLGLRQGTVTPGCRTVTPAMHQRVQDSGLSRIQLYTTTDAEFFKEYP